VIAMTTQRVIELRRALEPVSPDPFVEDLEPVGRPSGEAPPPSADATSEALRAED
jgi:hypothetical protein